jgi:hypothetical protein
VADGARVGVLVPNLFLRVPVDAAVRTAGAEPETVAGVAAAAAAPRVLVVDLDALGPEPEAVVRELVVQGKDVLAFGPHVKAQMLASCRAAGAVVLPRSVFLARLPELLLVALGTARRSSPPDH